MNLSNGDILAITSLFVSVGAVGVALRMFDVQRRDARIDNFVTRYIAMKREGTHSRDIHGFMTMLDAGILWLKDNDEVRDAVLLLEACRIPHPFNSDELEGDLLHFFRTANKERTNIGEMWGIIFTKVKAKESEMPPI